MNIADAGAPRSPVGRGRLGRAEQAGHEAVAVEPVAGDEAAVQLFPLPEPAA